MKLDPQILEMFKRAGRRGGKKAAKNLRDRLTKVEISERARRAAQARWKKKSSNSP